MPQDTPATNGRVTIAVVGNKVDNLTAIVLNTNRTVDNMRRELGEMRQVTAVNEERWRNHRDLHKRERGALGGLSAALTAVGTVFSVWWNGR